MSKSAEQEARDLLENYGLEDAQSLSAGDVVELANLIADVSRFQWLITKLRDMADDWAPPNVIYADRDAEESARDTVAFANELREILDRVGPT